MGSFTNAARRVRDAGRPYGARFRAFLWAIESYSRLTHERFHAVYDRLGVRHGFSWARRPTEQKLVAALAALERERVPYLAGLREFAERRREEKRQGRRQPTAADHGWGLHPFPPRPPQPPPGLTLRRGLQRAVIACGAVALAAFAALPFGGAVAAAIHNGALSGVMLLLPPLTLLVVEDLWTRDSLFTLRVRSRRHAHLVVSLALPTLVAGVFVGVLHHWLVFGGRIALTGERAVELVLGMIVGTAWMNLNTHIYFERGAFRPGLLFRTRRAPLLASGTIGPTLWAVTFSLLAVVGAVTGRVPFLIPGCLLIAYAALLVRAGVRGQAITEPAGP